MPITVRHTRLEAQNTDLETGGPAAALTTAYISSIFLYTAKSSVKLLTYLALFTVKNRYKYAHRRTEYNHALNK